MTVTGPAAVDTAAVVTNDRFPTAAQHDASPPI